MTISIKNLVLVIFGGIGNQLFMYATALRLAAQNGANLLVDTNSRFDSDSYQQRFQLEKFNIPLDIAPPKLKYAKRWSRI